MILIMAKDIIYGCLFNIKVIIQPLCNIPEAGGHFEMNFAAIQNRLPHS